MSRPVLIIALIVAAIAGVIYVIGTGRSVREIASPEALVYLVILLAVLVLSGAWKPESGRRASGKASIPVQILIWCGIFGALFAGYAIWEYDARHPRDFLQALSPHEVQESTGDGQNTVVLLRGRNGYFNAMARINDRDVYMLVDTGASDVVIPYHLAKDLGYDPDGLRFDNPAHTANGVTFYAGIEIPYIKIGNIIVRNVEGSVSPPDALGTALLGLSFLDRLSGYQFSGSRMTLRQ